MVPKSWHICVNKSLIYFALFLSKLGNKNYDVLITLGFILQARTAREDKKTAADGYRSCVLEVTIANFVCIPYE